MRITPHLIIASVALLLTALVALPRFGGTGLPSRVFDQEPTVLVENVLRPVITADAVLGPLSGEPIEIAEIGDPFLPPQQNQGRVSSRLPPPPPFDLPLPPALPLPSPLSEK